MNNKTRQEIRAAAIFILITLDSTHELYQQLAQLEADLAGEMGLTAETGYTEQWAPPAIVFVPTLRNKGEAIRRLADAMYPDYEEGDDRVFALLVDGVREYSQSGGDPSTPRWNIKATLGVIEENLEDLMGSD